MRINVITGRDLPADARAYAETKLRRLERHASLHDVRLTVGRAVTPVPEASAEIVVHLHRIRLAARCEAPNVREAIDGVIDKADEQVRRRRDRITGRRGRVGADAEPGG